MSEYIKKEDTIEYLNDLFGEMCHVSFGNVLQSIDSLQTYSIPETAKPCEYIKKADALRIASITTLSVDQVVSTIKALSTYSFPDSAADNTMEWIYEGDEISGVFKCSKCGMESEDMDFEDFHFCPNCGRKAVNK